MRVTVNGEPREIASSSVDALLAELEYEGTHFAIAVNYDVLPKSRWAETPLKSRRRDRDHHAAAGRVMGMMTSRTLSPRRPGERGTSTNPASRWNEGSAPRLERSRGWVPAFAGRRE